MTGIVGPVQQKRVAAGDQVHTADHNQLVTAVQYATQGAVGSDPSRPRESAIRLFDVSIIVQPTGGGATTAGFLQCLNNGATVGNTFPVLLPPIYTELSRPFTSGTVTYVYSDINTRVASGAAGPDETQLLTPPLLVGEVIQASWSSVNLAYLMQGDGRMWGTDPPP